MLWAPVGRLVHVVVEKGQNKEKGLDKREKSQWDTWLVAVLVWNLLEQPPAGREESSWCHWATPRPVLPLETTQAFKCILPFFPPP